MVRDWTDSFRFDGISADAERLFLRLIMKADDYGRFHSDPRMVKAFCFPLAENLRSNDLSRWLDELSTRQLVLRYEVDGRKCLAIPNYGQRLKQSKAKFPPMDGCPEDWLPTFREVPGSSGNPPPEGKGREVEEKEKGRERQQPPPPPVSGDGVLAGLRDVFPDAPKSLTAAEQRDLEESRPVLTEFSDEDWSASKAWVSATDRQRGRKLWPRDRREFIKNAGEAVEMIRKWWKRDGRKLTAKPQPVPIEPTGRTEDHEFLTPAQMSALLRGD